MAATHDPGATMLHENAGAALKVFQGGAISIDGIAGIALPEELAELLSGETVKSIYDISDEDFDKIFKAIRGNLEADREFTEWRARSGVKHTIDSYVDSGRIEGPPGTYEAPASGASGASVAPPAPEGYEGSSEGSSEASVAPPAPEASGASSTASSGASVDSSDSDSIPSLESSSSVVSSALAPAPAPVAPLNDSPAPAPAAVLRPKLTLSVLPKGSRRVGGEHNSSPKTQRRTLKNRRAATKVSPKKARRTLGHASRVSKKL